MRFPLKIQGLSSIDWWLFVLPILLVGIGIAAITSLTYGTERMSLAINQSIIAGIGFVLMIVFARIDYRGWRSTSGLLYLLGLILLVVVAVSGVSVFGARRWLDLGIFQLQPSEIWKFILVVVFAKWFAERRDFFLKDYLQLLMLVALPLGLVLFQPDFGTTFVLAVLMLSLLYHSTASKKILLGLVLGALLMIPLGWQFLADYQQQRVLTFLNPSADPYGAGYNVLQALIAVGSGGVAGQGLGQGSQSQLQFLPVAHTDFIFAGVAEATGFIGSLALILIFLFFTLRVLRVAEVAKDRFGRYLAIGFATLLLVQFFVNIGMNQALMPVTGIPLPFVSHGGTALLVNLMFVGLMQSIYLRHKKITF